MAAESWEPAEVASYVKIYPSYPFCHTKKNNNKINGSHVKRLAKNIFEILDLGKVSKDFSFF